ncbi:MAG: M28 family peptidase [Burkholderiaceae bacterium]|nr:M28 family peptidase [Sulfuritalea sp.]MCF8174535.1 M28 family peptidase [Burkholderiaceae bacterium]
MDKQAAFSSDEMMGWIREMAAFGARRAGSPAGLANEDYLAAKLTEFGLANVRKEPIPVEHYRPDSSRVEIDAGAGFQPFNAQWIPYCRFTPAAGIEAQLVFADSGALSHAGDWTGKVVVTEIEFPVLDVALIGKFSMGKHDPDDNLKDVKHPATWVRLGWHLYRKAIERGAVGFIGILKDQPGGSYQMYAPYGFKEKDILDKPLPGFWVSRNDGAQIRKLAEDGAKVRLTLTGERAPAVTHNIVGEIPGEIDEAVILHCHHDSPFVSPVEDASGCAVILALARHFAQGAKPCRKVIVLFTAGHFYGSIGTRTFIETHAVDVVPKVALEITVEHIAKEAVENEAGELVESGRSEGTGVFLPFNQAMVDAVLVNLKDNGVDRAFLLPPEGPLGPYPPTDGGDWYLSGVPLVNFISNPVYLLNAEDDFDWVDQPRLAKVAGAVAGIVEATEHLSKSAIGAVDFPLYKLKMKLIKYLVNWKTTKFGTRPVY